MGNSTPPTGARLGSRSGVSGEGPRFIQDRIALFAFICFVIGAVFLALSQTFLHFASSRVPSVDPARVIATLGWHAAGVSVLGLVWLTARSRVALTERWLTILDAFAVTLGALAFTLMGVASGDEGAANAGLMAAMCIVITRAILVPSEARRTLWVSVLAMAPIVISTWIVLRAVSPHDPRFKLAELGPLFVMMVVVDRSAWCAAAVTISTVASHVIYGLREQVREARQLGQYTLEERIGEGGMGAVYRARHALLRRPTAVKLLHKNNADPHTRSRFEREVQLTAMLTHPNTVSVYDYGHTPDGVFFYAMEYLDGYNFDELVALDGPQPAGRVIHLIAQACGALAEAHSVGLIHRDIKPANIFVCERGGLPDVVKVLDFGLVKNVSTADPTLSNVNTIAGTPLYMAPEAVLDPSAVDPRSDVYALGAVAYFLLTGTHVFSGQSIVEICGHHLHTEPEPPSVRLGRTVAPDLEALILACLAKDPAERPQTANDLAEQLHACGDDASWSERAARRWWSQRPERPANKVPASQSPSRVLEVGARRRSAGT